MILFWFSRQAPEIFKFSKPAYIQLSTLELVAHQNDSFSENSHVTMFK